MAALRRASRGHVGNGPRRASGALEAAVLNVLWETGEPLSAAEVRERLSSDGEGVTGAPAYTTVVTILTRLHEKKTLSRQRDGRAFRYTPVADRAGLAARRLAALLDASADRQAVLWRFVEDLSDRDEQLLRAVLDTRTASATTDQG